MSRCSAAAGVDPARPPVALPARVAAAAAVAHWRHPRPRPEWAARRTWTVAAARHSEAVAPARTKAVAERKGSWEVPGRGARPGAAQLAARRRRHQTALGLAAGAWRAWSAQRSEVAAQEAARQQLVPALAPEREVGTLGCEAPPAIPSAVVAEAARRAAAVAAR